MIPPLLAPLLPDGVPLVVIQECRVSRAGATYHALLAPVVPFMLDGQWTPDLNPDDPDYDVEDLSGTGAAPAEAVLDLIRLCARLTYGQVSEVTWDPSDPASVPSSRVWRIAWDPDTHSIRPVAATSWETITDPSSPEVNR